MVYDAHADELRVVGTTGVFFYSFISSGWSQDSADATAVIDVLYRPVASSMLSAGSWGRTDGEQMCKIRADGQLYYETETSDDHGMTWTTPWIKLDGIAGFGRLWKIILAIKTPPEDISSGLTYEVTLDSDYGGTTSRWTFGPTQISQWEQDAVVRLVLRPQKQRVNAIKISAVSAGTANSGIIPLSMKLEYGVDKSHRQGSGHRVASSYSEPA